MLNEGIIIKFSKSFVKFFPGIHYDWSGLSAKNVTGYRQIVNQYPA